MKEKQGTWDRPTNCHLFIHITDSVDTVPSLALLWAHLFLHEEREQRRTPKIDTGRDWSASTKYTDFSYCNCSYTIFKLSKWDIDMKRFIVTICHYCHRPHCCWLENAFIWSIFWPFLDRRVWRMGRDIQLIVRARAAALYTKLLDFLPLNCFMIFMYYFNEFIFI